MEYKDNELGSLRAGADAPVLLVVGEGLLATHALVAPSLIIGRAPDCDLVVDSATLSSRHICLRTGPPVTIQDLGSNSGTRVGGVYRRGGEPIPLQVGEAFHVGKLAFLLLEGPQTSSEPSEPSDFRAALCVIDPSRDRVSGDIREVAKSGLNVLIVGETGVGKEVLAETLHAWSERRGPFVRVNCAALSTTLVESELFGHEKGAFTDAGASRVGLVASADGGTLLLDEVAELSPQVQAKLLRVIEAKEVLRLGATKPTRVDVRFIAATNRDLPAEVASGQFRADLLYRLDGITLQIPPLRRRRQLIAPIAWKILDETEREAGRAAKPLPTEVLHLLEKHTWPGNVRELKAAISRAALLARGCPLSPQHFTLRAMSPSNSAAALAPTRAQSRVCPDAAATSTAEIEQRGRIVAALDACAGNQTRAARLLGVSRTTLVQKIQIYGIPRPRK